MLYKWYIYNKKKIVNFISWIQSPFFNAHISAHCSAIPVSINSTASNFTVLNNLSLSAQFHFSRGVWVPELPIRSPDYSMVASNRRSWNNWWIAALNFADLGINFTSASFVFFLFEFRTCFPRIDYTLSWSTPFQFISSIWFFLNVSISDYVYFCHNSVICGSLKWAGKFT